MRSGSAVSLGAALLFGAMAAFLARGLLQPGEAVANRTAPTRTVVVAAQPIAFGAALTSDNVKEGGLADANRS
jgi:pilus assembly protein CpaB